MLALTVPATGSALKSSKELSFLTVICLKFHQVWVGEQSVVLDSKRGLNKTSIAGFYLVRELRQHQIYVTQRKLQNRVEMVTMKVKDGG